MEVEVKILEVDPSRVIEKMEGVGARLIFSGDILTLYYDSPDGVIAKRRDLLRLRRVGDRSEITYKRFVSSVDLKIREEYETDVGSIEQLDKILGCLGFVETEKVVKKRVSYKTPNARVDIDVHLEKYSYIPPFLEIESDSKENIVELAGKLGYSDRDFKTLDFFDLAKYYPLRKEPSIPP